MQEPNFFYIDVHEDSKNNQLICWEETDKGIQKTTHELTDYLFAFQQDNTGNTTEYSDIYGNPLRKIRFKDKKSMADFSKRYDGLCASDVNAESKFIIWNYYNRTEFEAPATILFYDIEVDVDLAGMGGYPSIKNPYGEITAISMFHQKRQCYYMLIPHQFENKLTLNDDEYEGLPVNKIHCYGEKDMLEVFSEIILRDVAVLTGWNSSGFDLPYIMARATKLFGERKALSMFCRDGYPAKKREFTDKFGNDAVTYSLVGLTEIDMMEVFRKVKPGERESFSLSSIAQDELDMDKIDYDGDLGELYRENPQKYFEYSLHDVRLLKMLEDKLSIIKLALYMSRANCSKLAQFTGTVAMGENALQKFTLKRGIILPDRTEVESEEFDGALVYCTDKGRTGYTFSIDLNALYVRIMLILGVSKETMLFTCVDGHEDYLRIMHKTDDDVYIVDVLTGENIELKAFELERLIREEGYIIAPNGVIFNGKLGLIAQLVEFFNDSRNEYKALLKKAETEELKAKYDLAQLAWKLLGNSLYGTIGNKAFKLYDVRIAGAITSTAQMIGKYQNLYANDLIDKEFV